MSSNRSWSDIGINHVKPISSFDVLKDEGMREAFNWINTQLLVKKFQQHNGTKVDYPAHR